MHHSTSSRITFCQYAWLLLPAALLCVVYALIWWHGRRARSLTADLPRYPPVPIFGNFYQIVGNGEHLMNMLKDISRINDETGLPFVMMLGPEPYCIIMAEPDDVKAVTNAFVEKPYYYNFAREWVGNGLVTAPSEIWKRNIKKLAGTFTGSIVDGYQEVFNAQAQVLVDKLKGEVGGKPFDVMDKYLAYTTLETICQTALGVPRISDSIVTEEYYRCFTKVLELLIARGKNIFLHLDCVYRLTPASRELKKCIGVLHNVSDTIIATRMKEKESMKANGLLPKTSPENGRTKFKSFLDILFELREVDPSLTEQQIKNEVDTIIVGGQETVATTLFFVLLILGSRPDVQQKVYAELKAIFGGSTRPVNKEDLLRMEYCEAVINETLRTYPPIPFVMRNADRDLQLKSCTIPKGCGCGINVWAAGRLRRVWGADAGRFRPERWLGSDLGNYSASFLAFSYGKRACIGKRYAMALLKTMLAYCVRELAISSDMEHLRLKIEVSLKAVSGHLIQVDLRK